MDTRCPHRWQFAEAPAGLKLLESGRQGVTHHRSRIAGQGIAGSDKASQSPTSQNKAWQGPPVSRGPMPGATMRGCPSVFTSRVRQATNNIELRLKAPAEGTLVKVKVSWGYSTPHEPCVHGHKSRQHRHAYIVAHTPGWLCHVWSYLAYVNRRLQHLLHSV